MHNAKILRYLLFFLFFGHTSIICAQNTVTIGSETLNEKAVLMLVSPSGNQGLILPVVSNRSAINPSSGEKGMVVYDGSNDKIYFWTGSSWVDLVAGGSVAISSINQLDDVNGAGANPGQVLKWNGAAWEPADDEEGGGAGTDNQELGFNETTKILSIENGNTVDLSSLLGSSGSVDDWGAQVVQHDNSLKGDGTAANPLGLAQQTAASGQVLKWDGTNWTPANDNVASGSGGAVNTAPRLTGDGTTASPLDIAPQGADPGQVLKWDGSTWKPAADNEGSGGGATYTAGDGINIDGANVISNAGDSDNDPANEIQTIAFEAATNELSISGGNTITIPSGGTDADADPANELQTINKTGNLVTLSDGGGSFTDDVDDADADPSNEIQNLTLAGTTINISGGGTGVDIGTLIPPGGTDDQTASQVSFNNTTSGLTAGNVQAAIDELAASGTIDTDNQTLNFNTGTNILGIEDGNTVDLSSLAGGAGSSLWSENGDNIYYNEGNVGIGKNNPLTKLDVAGGQWDLTSTEGDFRIGNDTHRLKIGIATGGGGAGDVRIRAVGGTNRIMMGAGAKDVLTLNENNVGIGETNPSGTLHITKGYDATSAIKIETSAGDRSSILYTKTGSNSNWDQVVGIRTDAASGTMSYYYNDEGTGNHVMTMRGDKKVGIGTFNPTTNLEVSGEDVVSSRITSTNSGTAAMQWMLPGAANIDWTLVTGGAGANMQLTYSNSDLAGADVHTYFYDNGDMQVANTIGSGALTGTGDRNVVADALGNLKIGAGGSSLWTESGDDIYYSGNVGIGTSILDEAKLKIESTSDLPNIRSQKVYYGDTEVVGVESEAIGYGFGPVVGFKAKLTSQSRGFSSDIETNSSYRSYGFISKFSGTGSGIKYGIYTLGENQNYFSGKVGIGTSSGDAMLQIKNAYNTGQPFLELETSAGERANITFSKTGSTGNWDLIAGIRTSPASGTISYYYNEAGYSQNVLTLRGDGKVGINKSDPSVALDVIGDIHYTGSIMDVSDRRLKENIAKIDSALLKILSLNGYSYNMIDDSKKTREYGVVAQEVQKVMPHAVSVIDEDKGYLGVSYVQLVPVLIEALKEQQKIIDDHELKIDSQLTDIINHEKDIDGLKFKMIAMEAILKTMVDKEEKSTDYNVLSTMKEE